MTAVCLAASASPHALAQTSDGATELPAIEVQTTKKKAKKKAAKKNTAPAATAYQPAPQPEPFPSGGIIVSDPAVAGANPYAEPGAPYKVNQSANPKLTEPLLDTPKTVTTVTKEVLEDTQTTSVRDLARTTPGITLGYGEGGAVFGDNLYIRGFKANNDAYINGIRDSGTTSRETFMTEQVEILKGPSSSIGGRGTTGGALNIVTKKPQNQNFQNGSVTVGTDETIRTTVDINQVIDPTFQFRANGMWQEADVAGRDFVFDDRWGGALAARWTPTRNFSLTADYYHINLDQLSDWGVPYNNDINAPWPEAGLDRNNFYGIPNRDFQKGEQDIFTLTGQLKLTEGTWITNTFRRGRTESQYVVSAPGGTDTSDPDPNNWLAGVSYKSNDQVNNIIANQTDLTTNFRTGGLRHTMVAGVEFSDERVNKGGYEGLISEDFMGGRASCELNLFNPVAPGVGAGCWDGVSPPVPGTNRTRTNIMTKSVYLLDTIKLSDSFSINGGVRIDDYEVDRASTNGDPLQRQDTMVNWNAGAVYKPAPNGSIFAAVATSSNPMGQEIEGGGSAAYGGLDTGGVLLDPEENIAYEVGTKWELFQRKLLVTASLFQTEKDNAREDQGRGANAVITDTGKYRVRGFEASVGGKVSDRLSLFGGIVLMDSEVLKSVNEDDIGKELANFAHRSASLLAKYDLTPRLTIGGQITYQGTIALGTLADNGKKLPEAWRFDLLAEYDITENVELQLNVQNIFDEVVYDSGYRSGSPFVYIAPGRVGYATLNFKY